MGLVGAILGKKRVQFIQNNSTVIQFDASIKEDHGRESTPTEFPVEDGTTISDHMILRPFSLELTGTISDTPIGNLKGLLTEAATSVTAKLTPPVGVVALGAGFALFSALAKSSKPSVAAYGQLLQLQAAAVPFDVITTLYRYKSMWIKKISTPRESATANELMFTISLVQLILVQPQSVNIQIFANPGLAANTADVGNQSAELNGFKQGYATVNAQAASIGVGQ